MELDGDTCYQALLTHDTRFDGVFYVGVTSTGIYCRTVCTARTPRRENCLFFSGAASAERAGFRPCLRCRPELAPGNARIDSVSRLAASVAERIEAGELTKKNLEELAAEMGITSRHLRRVVQTEFGVTPLELVSTQRLLLAKRLLTDTQLPITEVAFASGFSSLRRFNALFREHYHRNPTELRKGQKSAAPAETLVCELAYRPPLHWDALLQFLAGRSITGVEIKQGERYLRTVAIGKHQGWIGVRPSTGKHTLQIEISLSLAYALLPILARVKRLFDLSSDPAAIASHLSTLAEGHPGLRVPGAFSGFEMAVRAILGQQISVKAATTLAGRFSTALGDPIETPFPALTHLSPTPERVAAASVEEITALGIVSARARSILALADAVTSKTLSLEPGANVEQTLCRLQELPGIGPWTAQVIAMRALSWPDAFPHTDLGILKALGETNPQRILEIAEAWRPWRSYAVMHLWKSLETSALETKALETKADDSRERTPKSSVLIPNP